jgi:hypothetical protein
MAVILNGDHLSMLEQIDIDIVAMLQNMKRVLESD